MIFIHLDFLSDFKKASISNLELQFKFNFCFFLDMGNTENAEKIRTSRFIRRHATGTAPIEVTTVAINRGIPWEEAHEK